MMTATRMPTCVTVRRTAICVIIGGGAIRRDTADVPAIGKMPCRTACREDRVRCCQERYRKMSDRAAHAAFSCKKLSGRPVAAEDSPVTTTLIKQFVGNSFGNRAGSFL